MRRAGGIEQHMIDRPGRKARERRTAEPGGGVCRINDAREHMRTTGRDRAMLAPGEPQRGINAVASHLRRQRLGVASTGADIMESKGSGGMCGRVSHLIADRNSVVYGKDVSGPVKSG